MDDLARDYFPASTSTLKEAAARSDAFERIARQHLGIRTLRARHMDALDIHEVGVCSLARALEAAYEAGFRAGLRTAEKGR